MSIITEDRHTTIRASVPGPVWGRRDHYGVLVVDYETYEASVHFQHELSSPYEFTVDTMVIPDINREIHNDDFMFYHNLMYVLSRTELVDLDFTPDENGTRITATTELVVARHRRYKYSGYLDSDYLEL